MQKPRASPQPAAGRAHGRICSPDQIPAIAAVSIDMCTSFVSTPSSSHTVHSCCRTCSSLLLTVWPGRPLPVSGAAEINQFVPHLDHSYIYYLEKRELRAMPIDLRPNGIFYSLPPQVHVCAYLYLFH